MDNCVFSNETPNAFQLSYFQEKFVFACIKINISIVSKQYVIRHADVKST